MLNGTYVATAENTQLTAQAQALILASGAETTAKMAKGIKGVFDGLA
jgi:hypothetical protein